MPYPESFPPEQLPDAEVQYDDVQPSDTEQLGAEHEGGQFDAEQPVDGAVGPTDEQASRWDRLRGRMAEMEVGDRLRRVVVAAGAGALEGAGLVRQDESGQLRPIGIGRALEVATELAADPRGGASALARRAAEGARDGGRKALKTEAARAWDDIQRTA